MTNTELLKKKIDESGYKIKFIAEKLGISYYGFLRKVNNDSEFKIKEVQTLCKLLNIRNDEREKIFFN